MKRFIRSLLTSVRHRVKTETSRMPFESAFKDALGFIHRNKLDGDYIEFGISTGSSMVEAVHYAAHFGKHTMTFHGFDSFEGMPPPTGQDKEESWKEGDMKGSYESVTKRVWAHNYSVKFYKGWYTDTLQEKHTFVPRIVHVDSDYYTSAVEVLTFLSKYPLDGVVIMFNDWFHFNGNPERGEQKAFAEWCVAENIDAVPFGTYAGKIQSFILNRRKV